MVESGKTYFLSRPRRFGKSLLVSTIEAYFKGEKDLFRGLTIGSLEAERGENAWLEYPVIRFSLSGGDYGIPNGLEDRFSSVIDDTIRSYELTGEFSVEGKTLPVRFLNLIKYLCLKTGRRVVVLVDEYDKPLLETMDENQEKRNRNLYKGFFSVLKDQDKYLKFVFFTGVTKFSKVSIFSDLNHLRDISLTDEYSTVCGITEKELRKNFGVEIQQLAGAELKDYRTENPDPIPLFYQSGYLTIAGYDMEFDLYKLKFPNEEVQYGFLNSLVPYVFGEKQEENPYSARTMVLALRKGDTAQLQKQLYSLFASIPYSEGKAKEYENTWRDQIYLVFALLGQYVECEQHTAEGRCDCVVRTADYIYLFEFKVDKTADEALTQIEEKDYAGRYQAERRKVFRIGVNFSSEKKNITEWKVR